MNYQTEKFLKDFAVYSLTFGIILLIAVGILQMTNRVNLKIEAKCMSESGQVLRTPGELSKCLLP